MYIYNYSMYIIFIIIYNYSIYIYNMNMYINDLANFHGFQLASERESRSTSSTMGMCSTRNRNSIEFQLGWGPQITKTLQVMWGNLPTRSVHIQTQYHTFFLDTLKRWFHFALIQDCLLLHLEVTWQALRFARRSTNWCWWIAAADARSSDWNVQNSVPLETATAEGLCSGGGDPFIFGRGGEDSDPPFSDTHSYIQIYQILVGGLEHFLFSHILGIVTPTD